MPARTSKSSLSASIRARNRRSPRRRKRLYLERYKQSGAERGWHFLTGDERRIKRGGEGGRFPLRVGRRRRSSSRIPAASSSSPRTVDRSRYLFGIEYGPRDVRCRLWKRRRAKSARPSIAAALLLSLRPDDRSIRRLDIMRALRVAGVATVLALATFIVVMVAGT